MIDSDLPPLPQLVPVANSAFTMRCMTDDALRELQREAFKAGMEKAAQQHRVSKVEPVSEDKRDAERLRPADEYDEEYSDVLWFAFPSFCEAPQCYVGSPLEVSPEFDSEHWTHFVRMDFNDIIGQAERLSAVPSPTKEST